MKSEDVFGLRTQILRLETLYDVARALPLRAGVKEIALEIVERGVALLDAARGVTILSDQRNRLDHLAWAGRRGTQKEDQQILRDPFFARLLSGSDAILLGPGKFAGRAHRSILGAPLQGTNGILGAIILFDKESRETEGSRLFSDDDARFLSALAALCAGALEGSRRVEQLEEERRRLLEENRLLRGRHQSLAGMGLVGDSPAFVRATGIAIRTARSRVSILLRGESGTGKEMVARLIHSESDRHDHPFLALNCSAIPETLLESELFGIDRGVATGVEARAGKFEVADGGTLFLDEIGDMPLVLQAKLLRVLAEKEIERVGGRRGIPVDVRIIAATHRPLEDMVAAGRFREDLLYRLRVVEIVLPPLRERREDLPALIRHFLRRLADENQIPEPSLSPESLTVLLSHDYPGNVRELENLLSGAVALGQGKEIGLEELRLLAPRLFEKRSFAPSSSHPIRPIPLREIEQEHVRAVLKLAGGNKSRAARLLGVDRKTVDRLVGKNEPLELKYTTN